MASPITFIVPLLLLLHRGPGVAATECYTALNVDIGEDIELTYVREEVDPSASSVCPWVVRANGSSTLTFEVVSFSGDPNTCDAVLSLHFFQPDSVSLKTQVLAQSCAEHGETVFVVSGPLAFITFESYRICDRFSLVIRRSPEEDQTYPFTSVGTDLILSNNFGKVDHYDSPNFKELSSFLIAPKGAFSPSFIEFKLPESCRTRYDEGDSCDASLQIYTLKKGIFSLETTLHEKMNHLQFWGDEMFLLVFRAEEWHTSGNPGGFQATWKVKTPGPTTACGKVIDISREDGLIEYTETDINGTLLRYDQQCVWTIRAPGISSIRITPENVQIPSCPAEGLYVTGFANGTSDLDSPLATYTHFFKPCEGQTEPAIVTGPLLFLVFVRSPGSLRLRVEAVDETFPVSYPFLSNFSDLYLTEGAGLQYWPMESSIAQNWRENQFTTFLVSPDPFLHFRQTKLRIGALYMGQSDSCWTANILIYEIRHGLRSQYMFCDMDEKTYVNVFGDHSILILLRTGRSWSNYQNQLSFSWNAVV